MDGWKATVSDYGFNKAKLTDLIRGIEGPGQDPQHLPLTRTDVPTIATERIVLGPCFN